MPDIAAMEWSWFAATVVSAGTIDGFMGYCEHCLLAGSLNV
jgi:hypothetical protein